MGVFFVKKRGPFLNAGCIMNSISIVYFTFYLFGGAYTPNAPPPAYGPVSLVRLGSYGYMVTVYVYG